MTQKLIIQASHIPDLNKYIDDERRNKFSAAKFKKEWTNIVKMLAIAYKLKPMKSPVAVYITFFVKDKRRDKDNFLINHKWILDGLVNAKVLQNDGWDDIHGIYFGWFIDKQERIEILLDSDEDLV